MLADLASGRFVMMHYGYSYRPEYLDPHIPRSSARDAAEALGAMPLVRGDFNCTAFDVRRRKPTHASLTAKAVGREWSPD